MTAVQLLPALESGEETLVGGQAVLEGVMMRSPHAWGISVRKPDGTISTHSEPLERLSEKHPWMGWPVIRGVMTLGQAMVLGFRALRYSADVALDQVPADENGKKAEISGWVAALNIILSVGFFIALYKFVPLVAATKLKNVYPVFGNQIMFNLVDGVMRIAIFLLFIWGVSLMPDIRRVYQYHGAEHKTVFAFESRDPLTVENAQTYSTFHPRCGTSFLMTVMLISIVIYMLFPVHTFWARFAAAHRAAAGDRRAVVRDDSLRRQAWVVAVCAADQAGTVAATDHDQASGGRPGGVRHHRAERSHGAGKSSRRRTGDCLAAITPTRAKAARVGGPDAPAAMNCSPNFECAEPILSSVFMFP